MSLADKPCYPISNSDGMSSHIIHTVDDNAQYGLTFRERLIIALAGNKAVCGTDYTGGSFDYGVNAEMIINQADAIIKKLDETT